MSDEHLEAEEAKTTTPSAWIRSATFSDGTTLEFKRSDIVVFVGPNNAGKSVTLKNFRDKLRRQETVTQVVQSIDLQREGSTEDVENWLKLTTRYNPTSGQEHFASFGAIVAESSIGYLWLRPSSFGDLAPFFCRLLDAESRLSAANPARGIRLGKDPLENPIHVLEKNAAVEQSMSGFFRKAFDEDIVIHRNAGNEVPVHVGQKPEKHPGEEQLDISYQDRLEALPRLNEQGDGMRSFFGILVNAFVLSPSILLIDEPEAFLHPPQARLLGQMLAQEKSPETQMFISTHSGDVLRGLLDANLDNIRVVRLQREGSINHVSNLPSSDIKQLWSNPLLRYSNILDGVFHSNVVVCEGDGDCRFYHAMLDAVCTDRTDKYRTDIMFVHAGGKHRTPLLVNALRALSVPVTAIFDFDVLNNEDPLKPAFQALGGSWSDIEKPWKTLSTQIGNKKPLKMRRVKREIEQILEENSKSATVTNQMVSDIREVISPPSPWQAVKKSGASAVPAGDATVAFGLLNAAFEAEQGFIVPVGELEGFVRSIGARNKNEWLASVLTRDLRNDPELKEARDFVGRIFPERDFHPET